MRVYAREGGRDAEGREGEREGWFEGGRAGVVCVCVPNPIR